MTSTVSVVTVSVVEVDVEVEVVVVSVVRVDDIRGLALGLQQRRAAE